MVRYLCVFGILCLIFNSCKNKAEVSIKNDKSDSSSLQEILPTYLVDFEYKKMSDIEFVTNYGRIMKMPSMLKGSNAINYRIWIWEDTGCVINFNINNIKDSCSVALFTTKKIDNKEYIVVLKELKNLYPQAGWPNFADTVEKYKYYFLESDYMDLTRKDFMDRMVYIQIEINQHGNYHFSKYLEPSFYRFTDSTSRRVFNFLKYFDYEFKVLAYNPDEKLFAHPK